MTRLEAHYQPNMMQETPLTRYRSRVGRSGKCRPILAALLAAGHIYSTPAFSVWGGEEYIAVPDVSDATQSKKVIKRVYVVNRGKPVSDDVGNTYQFQNYVVKDTYYLNGSNNQIILKRRTSVTIQISGTFTGTVSISGNQSYQRNAGEEVLQQTVSRQNLTQNLTQVAATGTATQTLGFRFGSLSEPPSYGGLKGVFLLDPGYSFKSPPGSDKPTRASLSGSLCLSSQPNQPCSALDSENISFSKQLGWEVQEKLESLSVKAGTFSKVTTVVQSEPLFNLEYSTSCPSGLSQCLISPTQATTAKATSWVAEGIGVIKYQGPFFVNGLTITYELKKCPIINGELTDCGD